MKATVWKIAGLLCGILVLQGCVAYPVADGPHHGRRDWDGPGYRPPAPAYRDHDHEPRFSAPPPRANAGPQRREPSPREREPERGRWERSRY